LDEEALVVKTLYNEKWEIGTVNTTNICGNFIYIIAAGFRLTLLSCDCVNKRKCYNKTSFVFRAIFLNFNCTKHKGMPSYRSIQMFYWFHILKPKDVNLYVIAVLKITLINSHKQ
jgi:hypothetical protein